MRYTHPQGHERVVLVTSAVSQLCCHELGNRLNLRDHLSFGLVKPDDGRCEFKSKYLTVSKKQVLLMSLFRSPLDNVAECIHDRLAGLVFCHLKHVINKKRRGIGNQSKGKHSSINLNRRPVVGPKDLHDGTAALRSTALGQHLVGQRHRHLKGLGNTTPHGLGLHPAKHLYQFVEDVGPSLTLIIRQSCQFSKESQSSILILDDTLVINSLHVQRLHIDLICKCQNYELF